jgi:hypothetical protein
MRLACVKRRISPVMPHSGLAAVAFLLSKVDDYENLS